MKILLIIFAIILVLTLVSSIKISGDISKAEDAEIEKQISKKKSGS